MSNGNIRIGRVTEDPEPALPVGSQIHFVALLMPNLPVQAPSRLDRWESLDGMVLAISFSDTDAHRLDGTAVIVGPGIAICATHVIQPRLERLMSGAESISCFAIASSGIQMWNVRKITLVPNSDLAILGLAFASELPPDNTLYKVSISTRLPEIGEHLTIIGLRPFRESFSRAGTTATFEAGVLVCTGIVSERYPMGRDTVMLPWPVIELDCPAWGGMSGGPVFDQAGKVVGLLSTSFSADNNSGPSYVSLLTPALTTRFEGGWPAALFSNPTTLREMGRQLCTID